MNTWIPPLDTPARILHISSTAWQSSSILRDSWPYCHFGPFGLQFFMVPMKICWCWQPAWPAPGVSVTARGRAGQVWLQWPQESVNFCASLKLISWYLLLIHHESWLQRAHQSGVFLFNQGPKTLSLWSQDCSLHIFFSDLFLECVPSFKILF